MQDMHPPTSCMTEDEKVQTPCLGLLVRNSVPSALDEHSDYKRSYVTRIQTNRSKRCRPDEKVGLLRIKANGEMRTMRKEGNSEEKDLAEEINR